jgi:hypothetical protein
LQGLKVRLEKRAPCVPTRMLNLTLLPRAIRASFSGRSNFFHKRCHLVVVVSVLFRLREWFGETMFQAVPRGVDKGLNSELGREPPQGINAEHAIANLSAWAAPAVAVCCNVHWVVTR